MIKNIIFDIGNVILKFDKDFLLSTFYKGKGEDYDLLKEKLFSDWEMLDQDLISLKEYKERVLFALPSHLKPYANAVLDYWEYCMWYTPKIIDLIRELKLKGYKLYVLSNMTRHFIEREYKFPIFNEFDGIVYSAPIKMVKPDGKIFTYILDKFNLNPEECIFVDDTKKNLVGATRFNFHTFHFQDNVEDLARFIYSF